MTITVFGIYCRDDKHGIFFRTEGKKKRDLWPLVKKHVHPKTEFICTDSAKQYSGVEKLFGGAIHKTVNHKKGEFVSKSDKTNHINSIENQNKHLKASIKCRRSDEHIRQYMALYFYRKTRLDVWKDLGGKIHQFLLDVSTVYPGYGKEKLFLKSLDLPTPESEGILDLMPSGSNAEFHFSESDDGEIPFVDDPNDEDWFY